MFLQRIQSQSLKTRITVLTLLIVVLGFLALGAYTKALLRDELLLLTGEQQRSALNLFTAEVNHGLQDRLDSLKTVAVQCGHDDLGPPGGAADAGAILEGWI